MEIYEVPFGRCPSDGTHTLSKMRDDEAIATVFRHTYTEPLSRWNRITGLFLGHKYEPKHHSSELTISDRDMRTVSHTTRIPAFIRVAKANERKVAYWLQGDHDEWKC